MFVLDNLNKVSVVLLLGNKMIGKLSEERISQSVWELNELAYTYSYMRISSYACIYSEMNVLQTL